MNPQPTSLAHVAHLRQRELRDLSRKLQKAEISVQGARAELDRRLYLWHQDGTSVTDLALEAGMSRETVYRALDRVRADVKGKR